jgi:hypothetical protein
MQPLNEKDSYVQKFLDGWNIQMIAEHYKISKVDVENAVRGSFIRLNSKEDERVLEEKINSVNSVITGDIYLRYDGDVCEIVGTGKHTVYSGKLIIYKYQGSKELIAEPAEDFFGTVCMNSNHVPQFTKLPKIRPA